jgi:propanol-preferring alcohol dehydrogenase
MVLRRQAPIREMPLQALDLPEPEPREGEVLVRVRACAVCRTDLHVVEGDLPRARLPLVPGHQVVGIVERLGDGCRRLRVGDRVGIAWLRQTCGTCTFCTSGAENLCDASQYTGYHVDGGYAEYAVVREDFAYNVPEAFSDLEASPLLCAGIIGYRALRRSEVPPHGKLGLFGFGSSAHVVLQIALKRGCDVFVCTRGSGHRALAKSLGASWVGGTSDPVPVPLDGAIVFAPAGEIVPAALRAIRKGGTVAIAAIHMSPLPSMDYSECLFHEKNLTSVEASTRADGEALLREAAEARIHPRTTTFPLDEANEVLGRLGTGDLDGTAVLTPG